MIRMVQVSADYGDFVLKNITLEIEQGEIFVIMGPSGAGKTVILELIAGLHEPRSGNIFIGGKDAKNVLPEERKIGFVYQDYLLFPHLSVYDNIAFGLFLKKMPSSQVKERVYSMAELMNISHLLTRCPGTLSGGEQQRVAMARAMIMDPRILLLDEPFSALDRNLKKSLYGMIKEIHSGCKCAIVLVTHDLLEAALLADRIGIILNGELKQVGKTPDVFCNPCDSEVAAFLGIEQPGASFGEAASFL